MRAAGQHTKANTQGDKNWNAGFFFQPKLSVNQPGDVYEQEADGLRVEQQVQLLMPFLKA